MTITKKSNEAITKNIQQWETQIFYRITDLSKSINNEKREELIQEINFYFGRLYGIQDTLSDLNIIYDFESMYKRIKTYMVQKIYNNNVAYIINTKYKFTAFGQFYN